MASLLVENLMTVRITQRPAPEAGVGMRRLWRIEWVTEQPCDLHETPVELETYLAQITRLQRRAVARIELWCSSIANLLIGIGTLSRLQVNHGASWRVTFTSTKPQ